MADKDSKQVGGGDLWDKMRMKMFYSLEATSHCHKWWQKCFWGIIDGALVNAFICWRHHARRAWGSWLASIKLSSITSGTPLVTGVLAAFSLLMLLADKRSSKENTWTKHHQHPLPLSQQWNPQLVSHTSLSCSTKPLCIRIWFGGRRWSQMQKLRKDVFSARKMADRMFSRSGSVWVVVIFLYATQNGTGKCIITAFRNTMLRRRFH